MGSLTIQPSEFIPLKHCYTEAFLLRDMGLKVNGFEFPCGTVFLSHVVFGLKYLPCLEEKTPQPMSDAGFVFNFLGQQKQVGKRSAASYA